MAGHIYYKDEDGHVFTNSTDTWRGVKGSTLISHGEWSDPEVAYKGGLYNYYDLEDYCEIAYRDYLAENGLTEKDYTLDQFCEETDEPICALIDLEPTETYEMA